MTKICFISDTHGSHHEVKIPECDILVHAGDCTSDAGQASLRDFCRWLEAQPAKHKVFIAGNHDWAFEKWPDLAQSMVREFAPSAIYLQDSGVEIMGLDFWGSPWSPRFFDWAFNQDRGEPSRKRWDGLPMMPDVLITHGPPNGILDMAKGFDTKKLEHAGCEELAIAVERTKPRIHVFGHIHAGYGFHEGVETASINASICNEAYLPINKPFVYDLK